MSEKRSLEESESTRLEALYRKASDPVLRTHLLMVWRMSLGDPIREVARMVGYSEKWTREIARRYEEQGLEGLGDRRHGNPGAKERALLDEEGQVQLREALSWRVHHRAGGCGAGRRWLGGSSRRAAFRRFMPNEAGSTSGR
jgi:hypothetical protein